MGLQLMFLLLKICLILSSLSVHASSVPVSSQSPASLIIESKRHEIPIATPQNKYFGRSSPKGHFPTKATHPYHNYAGGRSSIALPPRSSIRVPGKREASISASPPSRSAYRHRNKFINIAPQPSYLALSPRSNQHGLPIHPPRAALPPSKHWSLTAPAPASTRTIQLHFPALPPSAPFMTLPPPPPNEDCTAVTCTEPLTYAPSGSPCGCVLPIQVKLNLPVALYTFFPLVTELAKEIAASLPVESSQVRIMGANSVNHQQEKTTVIISLVPEGTKFNKNTALLIYKKFWHRKVYIKTSLFGAYEVLYVRYPGLPPSPPTGPLDMAAIYDQQHHRGLDNNGMAMKPLGVEVPKRERNEIGGSMTGVIVLSLFAALALSVGIAFVFLLRCRASAQDHKIFHPSDSPPAKTLGPKPPKSLLYNSSMQDSRHSSFPSATLTYTGSAKVFTFKELKTATNNFDSTRILGEGGFGIVYKGILDNEREVAVKVLKRDDRHGDREFFAEVEMLSRLHHRNLVKLIGLCAERNARCLVYELIPNGSVQTHLHGTDKMREPLDWDARMKIALGAARGLAYLHEDSSPCVIHRDFKSSNILLEHDFTPKVSDFGLARTALDEKNKYISTHVMGTFGYLAPEYAMTGHLLVKSDVYSYGVVLLELLTGRKPVDLSQPFGQENLVNWARPMLTSKEGLKSIIDPSIKSSFLFDSVAKVATIASMCVQPEVSNRPFMGEVVQALKLVCNDFDEPEQPNSRIGSPENVLVEIKGRSSINSADLQKLSLSPSPIPYNSSDLDTRAALSDSNYYMPSLCFEEQNFGSFRRDYNSEPLVGRRNQLLERLRRLPGGSMSENRNPFKLWPGSY